MKDLNKPITWCKHGRSCYVDCPECHAEKLEQRVNKLEAMMGILPGVISEFLCDTRIDESVRAEYQERVRRDYERRSLEPLIPKPTRAKLHQILAQYVVAGDGYEEVE